MVYAVKSKVVLLTMSWQDSYNQTAVKLINILMSVHHRVQRDQLLQRGGTFVLLQDEGPSTGWKQNVLPPAAS